LGALVAVSVVVSIAVGALEVELGAVLSALGKASAGEPLASTAERLVVWIRLPRALCAAAVGASLGAAGALFQGLVRNPLADPGLLGLSAGAALGAALALVTLSGTALGLAAGLWLVPLSAFGVSLSAAALVVAAGRKMERIDPASLLLAGVAVSALGFAGTGLLQTVANDSELRSLTFWTLGSFNGAGYPALAVALLGALPLCALTPAVARRLDALSLGEAEARRLGVGVDGLAWAVCAAVALATATSVAMVGSIGFVGLVAPHIARRLVGPHHGVLAMGSALCGALLLGIADAVSRVVVAPAELGVGIVTALGGAPFFLWLLQRGQVTR
jgi:iron complex transport system permease protein